MVIARAKPDDAATLTRIAFAAKRHWSYPPGWMRRWKSQLTITPGYVVAHAVFVARSKRIPLGFCAVQLSGAIAVIDHLWVLPAAMGRGIGRALFERAEQFIKKAGVSRVSMIADPNAEGFYQRMGATTVDRESAPMNRQPRFLPVLEKDLR
jgi:GNAT superfamily N-acetyltransferase